MAQVKLYDTTLRDGAQSEGISFSVVDKLHITRKLDELGVHYIEGGWPGSNPKDAEFFEKARGLSLRNSQIVLFGSTRRHGMKAEEDGNLVIRDLLVKHYPIILRLSSVRQVFLPLVLKDHHR